MMVIPEAYLNRILVRKWVCLITLLAFGLTSAGLGYAQMPLMTPGIAAVTRPQFQGVKIFDQEPFRFEFLMDHVQQTASRIETHRLIKYFFTALALPEKDLWVNLSPYEPDRILTSEFARTAMGQDLLAQDLVLKKMTTAFLSPDHKVGRAFWDKVYSRLKDRYGTRDIPVEAINKVWIVPEKAEVFENRDEGKGKRGKVSALILESRLRVMVESDYVALSRNALPGSLAPAAPESDIAKEVLREIVIPALEEQVNNGKDFVQLRQVFHSLILAAWYKRKVKETVLALHYVDQKKISGLEKQDASSEQIYQQYLAAYHDGLKGMIIENVNVDTGEMIPRKYATGGILGDLSMLVVSTDNRAAQGKGWSLEKGQRVAVLGYPITRGFDAAEISRSAVDFQQQFTAFKNLYAEISILEKMITAENAESPLGRGIKEPFVAVETYLEFIGSFKGEYAFDKKSYHQLHRSMMQEMEELYDYLGFFTDRETLTEWSRNYIDKFDHLTRIARISEGDAINSSSSLRRVLREENHWEKHHIARFILAEKLPDNIMNAVSDIARSYREQYEALTLAVNHLARQKGIAEAALWPEFPLNQKGSSFQRAEAAVQWFSTVRNRLYRDDWESVATLVPKSYEDVKAGLENKFLPGKSAEILAAMDGWGWFVSLGNSSEKRFLKSDIPEMYDRLDQAFPGRVVIRFVKDGLTNDDIGKDLGVLTDAKLLRVVGKGVYLIQEGDVEKARMGGELKRLLKESPTLAQGIIETLVRPQTLSGLLSAHITNNYWPVFEFGWDLLNRNTDIQKRKAGYAHLSEGLQALRLGLQRSLPVLKMILEIKDVNPVREKYQRLISKYHGTYRSPIPSQSLFVFFIGRDFFSKGDEGLRNFKDFRNGVAALLDGWPKFEMAIREYLREVDASVSMAAEDARLTVSRTSVSGESALRGGDSAQQGGIDFNISRLSLDVKTAPSARLSENSSTRGALTQNISGIVPVIVSVRSAGSLVDFGVTVAVEGEGYWKQ